MKKESKYKHYILPVTLLLLALLAVKFKLIDLTSLIDSESKSIHFNLITINAVFAGFLFTSITFFIGVNTTKTVEVLEKIEYMDKVYINLNFGFIASLVSIILSLLSIFVLPTLLDLVIVKNSSITLYIIDTMIPSMVLTSLMYTIIKFFVALRHLTFIIGSIRRKSKLNAPSPESIEETLKQIK